MRTAVAALAALLALPAVDAFAQAGGAAPPAAPTWSASASLFTYVVPDDDDYVQPTVTADRDWLHVQVRFNYEDQHTVSAWMGRSFSVGETVTLDITPMGGVVAGNTSGGAFGYTGSLSWRALDLTSETEYVLAAGDGESFLYTWSELGWSPTDWFRGGLAVQRTKVYQTPFDIQRGFFGAVTVRRWTVSGYVFNPDADTPTVVIGVAVEF